MYLYLYDSFLNSSKHTKMLARVEMRLTDLGIGGKIARLSPLKNIRELIKDEVKNGVKTVVAVGNDKTVIQIVNDIAEHAVTLGIIPVGKNNKIAAALGISGTDEACPILSARKLEKIDLGKANNTYFLSDIFVPKSNVTLLCENRYEIRPEKGEFEVFICNIKPDHVTEDYVFSPKDGMLEAVINPTNTVPASFLRRARQGEKKTTIVPFKKLLIKSRTPQEIITDGNKILKTPVEVSIVPKKLKIIVGKERIF